MLDREIYGSGSDAEDGANPVGEQIDLLRTAFQR